LSCSAELLEEANLSTSKGFLKILVKRIDVDGEKVTIHYTLPVPPQHKTEETVSVLPIDTQSGIKCPKCAKNVLAKCQTSLSQLICRLN
jgi:hypothetical protein